jgi:hypothetical protein
MSYATNQATSHVTVSGPQMVYVQTAALTTVTSAVAAATFRNIEVKGVVRINAGGTFIPNMAFSAAPGAVGTVAINSYIKLTPMGTNTDTTIGNWA